MRHSSVSQIISWNWKHLINHKCRVLTHYILYSYLCNTLCKLFIKIESNYNDFPKYILKLKAHDKSIEARKKLYCHVTVSNYLCNALWMFLIKIARGGARRGDFKEQAPQLTLRHCGRTVRSSHLRWSIKKAVLKNFAISTGNSCVGVSF